MLLRLYTSSQPALLISFPVFAALGLWPLWGYLPADPRLFSNDSDHWLAALRLPGEALWLLKLVLVSVGAWQVNALYNRHEFYPSAVFAPGLVYVLIAVGMAPYYQPDTALLANCFVIAGIDQVLRVYHQPRVLSEYFMAGMYMGCAALLYPPLFVLLPALWASVSFTRTFRWREYAVPLLAFVSPFVWWIAIRIIAGVSDPAVMFHFSSTADMDRWWSTTAWTARITWILVAFAVLVGLPRFFNPGGRVTNRARNLSGVFMIFAVFIALAVLLEARLNGYWPLILLCVPFSVFAGHWYTNYRYSLLAPFVFYTWIASLVVWLMWLAY